MNYSFPGQGKSLTEMNCSRRIFSCSAEPSRPRQ